MTTTDVIDGLSPSSIRMMVQQVHGDIQITDEAIIVLQEILRPFITGLSTISNDRNSVHQYLEKSMPGVI